MGDDAEISSSEDFGAYCSSFSDTIGGFMVRKRRYECGPKR